MTVNEAGRKLGVDDEMMKPMLTSAPPAIRSSQDCVGSVAPLTVPEERLGSCELAGGEREGGRGREGGGGNEGVEISPSPATQ